MRNAKICSTSGSTHIYLLELMGQNGVGYYPIFKKESLDGTILFAKSYFGEIAPNSFALTHSCSHMYALNVGVQGVVEVDTGTGAARLISITG